MSAFELWPLTGLLSILLETDKQQCTGEMKLYGRGELEGKFVSVPICPPQIPYELTWGPQPDQHE